MLTVFMTLLGNSLVAVPFILIILSVRALTAKLPKIYMRVLWLLLFIQLVLPPIFVSPLGLVQETVRNALEAGEAAAAGSPGESGYQMVYGDNPSGAYKEKREPSGYPAGAEYHGAYTGNGRSEARNGQDIPEPGSNILLGGVWRRGSLGFAYLWLAGTLCVMLFYMADFLRLKKRISQAIRLEGNIWETEGIDVPFVLPGFPSRIYLPSGLKEMYREDILVHERQHIRQGDPWIKPAAFAVAALHWYNPLVWVAIRCMSRDMEMLCDERALRGRSLEERKRYSGTLLACSMVNHGFSVGLPFGESNTEGRIRHILYGRKPGIILSVVLGAVILACCAVFLTTGGGRKARQGDELKAFGQILPDREASVYGEAVLRQGAYAEELSTYTFKADYDGNGTEEAFVGVGQAVDEGLYGDVWYTDGESSVRLLQNVDFPQEQEYLQSDTARYLLLSYGEGNGTVTGVYTVRDGRPEDALPYGTAKRLAEDGKVLVSQSALDAGFVMEEDEEGGLNAAWSGRTLKDYLFEYQNGAFAEITARELSGEELLRQPYGEAVREQAEKASSDGKPAGQQYLLREDSLMVNFAWELEDGAEFRYISFDVTDPETPMLRESGDGYYLTALSGIGNWSVPARLEESMGTAMSVKAAAEEQGRALGIVGESFTPEGELLEALTGNVPDYSEDWDSFPVLYAEDNGGRKEGLRNGVSLLRRSAGFTLYGADDTESMILKTWDGSYVKIEEPFLSTYMIQPELWENDFDGDGELEAAIRCVVLHGTGYMVESLFMADRSGSVWQVYSMEEDFYLEQLGRQYSTELIPADRTSEGNAVLRMALDGKTVGIPRDSLEKEEANPYFSAGNQIRYLFDGEAVMLIADLGVYSDQNFSGNYFGDRIAARVRFDGGGQWRMEDFRYIDSGLEERVSNALRAYFEGEKGTDELNRGSAARGHALEGRRAAPVEIEVTDIRYDASDMEREPLTVTAEVSEKGRDATIVLTLEALYELTEEDSMSGEWRIVSILER